jgi:hypothetical protein
MTNPVFTVEGDLVEVLSSSELSPDGDVVFERVDMRSKAEPDQIISVNHVVVPPDLAAEFKVGVKTRLVLFGVPSLRSRLIAGRFGVTSYLRVPDTFKKIRKNGFGISAVLGAVALACIYKWHGWGVIPAAVFLVPVMPLVRFAKAYPSYESIKKLLEQGD